MTRRARWNLLLTGFCLIVGALCIKFPALIIILLALGAILGLTFVIDWLVEWAERGE